MINPENKDLDGGIRNRVEESGLIQIDLGQLSEIKCVELDFTDWLWNGMIVKEKEFMCAASPSIKERKFRFLRSASTDGDGPSPPRTGSVDVDGSIGRGGRKLSNIPWCLR